MVTLDAPTAYLAAPWSRRHLMPGIAQTLAARGVRVLSTWDRYPDTTDPGILSTCAQRDFDEVQQAVFFVLLYPHIVSMGKSVELGRALTLRKRVIVVDPQISRAGCIFYHLPQIHYAPSVQAAADFMLNLDLPFIEQAHSLDQPERDPLRTCQP